VLRKEGEPEGEELLGPISQRRHELQEKARVLGMRVYSERPEDLRRRLRGYWRAWEEERRRMSGAAPAPAASTIPLERVADTRCRTGEGPLWHGPEQRLYWVDIPEGRLYRYDPATGAHEQVFQGEPIGGFTVQADGSLLLFMARGAIAVWRPDRPLSPVVEEIPVERDSRFNDVIADPEGRVFCGTMPGPAGGGRLYRLDRDGTLTELLDGVGLPNGLGFSPDGGRMYFADSKAGVIWRFAYDRVTGELSDRRVFADTAGREGAPDGLAVDAEGGVWCARWNGGCLVRYRPDGGEERRVELPARKVSSACFGGPGLDELYVTTAGGPDRDREGPGAGALFRLRPGLRGRPGFPSRIGL
jgi:D-xylonolactonase